MLCFGDTNGKVQNDKISIFTAVQMHYDCHLISNYFSNYQFFSHTKHNNKSQTYTMSKKCSTITFIFTTSGETK